MQKLIYNILQNFCEIVLPSLLKMSFSKDFKQIFQKLLEEFAQQIIKTTYDELSFYFHKELNLQISKLKAEYLNANNVGSFETEGPLDLTVEKTTKKSFIASDNSTQLIKSASDVTENKLSPETFNFQLADNLLAQTITQLETKVSSLTTTIVSTSKSANTNLFENISDESDFSELSSLPSEVAPAEVPVASDIDNSLLMISQPANDTTTTQLDPPITTASNSDTTACSAKSSKNKTNSSENSDFLPPTKKQKLFAASYLKPSVLLTVSVPSNNQLFKPSQNATNAISTTKRIVTFKNLSDDKNIKKEHWSDDGFGNVTVLKIDCPESTCSEMFDNKTDYEKHQRTVHRQEPFFCLVDSCNRAYSSL